MENEKTSKITQKHDKAFKKALEDPEEMSKFLSNFLGINISRRVGNEEMSTLIERLRRENDAIRKEAREQAIKELKGTVEKQVRKEVEKEVRGKVEEEVRGKVEEEVRGKVEKEVRGKVEEVKENLIIKMLKNKEEDEKIKMYFNVTDEQIKQRKIQLGIAF